MSRGAIVRDLPVVGRLRVAEILPCSMSGKKVKGFPIAKI
jgi:hypothetical protein